MGRPERPLDPDAGQVQRFAWELRRLREKAGSPSYRQLSRRAHFSSTALSEAAGGDQLPSLAVTMAYVRACDGDAEAWEERWRAVAAEVGVPGRDDSPPYLGLAAYQPADAERFFGREALVAELVDRLSRQWAVGVFGPSGCGKSSLLLAGLVPAAPWPAVVLTPTAHPVRELANRVGDGTGLVVVDQFEEVFTLCRDAGERNRFVAALAETGARVVFACRADFHDRCADLPLPGERVHVGPMTGAELRRAVEEPAARRGLRVDPDLVSVALTEVPGQAGALPWLSQALLETWRRREGGRLTLAGYRAAGGLTGSIAATAEQVYTTLAPHAQVAARGVLPRLVRGGEHDPRRRAPLSEVLAVGDPTETAAVVDALAAARLVVVGDSFVELAHEALTDAWPRLREWLDADGESLHVHRDLTSAAAAWEAHDRDPGSLYRGTRLAAANTLAERDDWPALSTPSEREFLDASTAQEAGWRQTRRGRRLVQALGALVTAGLLVAVVALWTATHDQDPAAPIGKCTPLWSPMHELVCG